MPRARVKAEAEEPAQPKASRARKAQLLQSDVPTYALEEAIRVPMAIGDNYAAKPTRPMDVAAAMDTTPGASRFRMITSAAFVYGLTTGTSFAAEIGITPLGMRIIRPMIDGDDVAAKREALLKPRIIAEFLRKYDGAPLPSDAIAQNVLQESGVPAERLPAVLKFVLDSASAVGFLRDIGGKRYVDLASVAPSASADVSMSTEAPPVLAPPQQRPSPDPISPSPGAGAVAVAVSPSVYVNIEIHIAADASSDTIEDIFKNMRRYVLNSSEPLGNDASYAD